MIKSLIFSLFFTFCAWQAHAQNALLENLNQTVQKNWRINFSTTHLEGFGDKRVEPSTIFGLSLNHTISKTTTLVASVRGTKVYYVDFKGENEFKISDPYFGLRHIFPAIKLFGDATPMLSYGLQAPFSEFSRRNDVYTKAILSGSLTWSFLDGLWSITPDASLVYFLNRYTTRQSNEAGTSGGSLLPQFDVATGVSLNYSLGQNLGFKNSFLKSLLLSTYASYGVTNYESFKVTPVAYTGLREHDDYYNLSASIVASPYKGWFISAGYGHDATIQTLGRTEYYLFDKLSSRWRMGLRYTKRF